MQFKITISHFQPTSLPGGLFSSKSTYPWLLRWVFRNINSPKLIGRKLPIYLLKGFSSFPISYIAKGLCINTSSGGFPVCTLECSLGWFDVYFTCPFLERRQFQVGKRGVARMHATDSNSLFDVHFQKKNVKWSDSRPSCEMPPRILMHPHESWCQGCKGHSIRVQKMKTSPLSSLNALLSGESRGICSTEMSL